MALTDNELEELCHKAVEGKGADEEHGNCTLVHVMQEHPDLLATTIRTVSRMVRAGSFSLKLVNLPDVQPPEAQTSTFQFPNESSSSSVDNEVPAATNAQRNRDLVFALCESLAEELHAITMIEAGERLEGDDLRKAHERHAIRAFFGIESALLLPAELQRRRGNELSDAQYVAALASMPLLFAEMDRAVWLAAGARGMSAEQVELAKQEDAVRRAHNAPFACLLPFAASVSPHLSKQKNEVLVDPADSVSVPAHTDDYDADGIRVYDFSNHPRTTEPVSKGIECGDSKGVVCDPKAFSVEWAPWWVRPNPGQSG
ncbi:MAG: hypothetical protein PHZ00_06865 [Candidatus Peribacteraceae bacterium]|nr:hypothetical protein [Candidatus Peribacteraceae bacterium]